MTHPRIPQGLSDYQAALRAGDARVAYEVIDGMIDAGVSFDELCEDVVRPAMYEIGELWEAGEITVADEHVAAAITDTILACVGPFSRADIEGSQRVLVCCSDGELHALGARMVGETFAAAEWSVQYLGASLPAEAVASAVVDRRIDVLAISTTMPAHLPAVAETISAAREAASDLRVVVGGQAYGGDHRRAREIGANLLHDGLRGLVEKVEGALPG
jgi:MerR family transcriptional regulator, light-induced transcriptional regulator